jgi:hypothetical protein
MFTIKLREVYSRHPKIVVGPFMVLPPLITIMHHTTHSGSIVSFEHVNRGLGNFVLTLDQGGVRRIPHIHTLVSLVITVAAGPPPFLAR